MTTVSEAELLEVVSALTTADLAFLTELGPLVTAAVSLGVCADTRTFARLFDVSHALTLRECVHLEAELGLLSTEDRGDKSGRLFLTLTEAGQQAAVAGVTL